MDEIDYIPTPFAQVSDDVLGVVSLVRQGMGICQSYDFIVRELVQAGDLVELLPQLRGRSRPFSLVYAPHRSQSAASRALIEVLAATDSLAT